MSQDTTTVDTGTRGVGRRTLAKGAAWAVPAVIAAGAAPLVAASDGYVTITSGGDACKLPGSSCDVTKGYTQPFLVCSTVKYPVAVTMDPNQYLAVNGTNVLITNYFWSGGSGPVLYLGTSSDGSQFCDTFFVQLEMDSSANSSLVGTLTYTWNTVAPDPLLNGDGSSIINTVTTPPCDQCQPPASMTWQADHAYAVGDQIQTMDTSNNTLTFKVTTAGTSGATPPNWASVAVGATVTDNGVIWTRTA